MKDWWRGAVVYQIYPRSFQDDSGDGIGDLRGIIRRLDHVARLGADAIWLSPVFTSPMADMGYDVSDYCDIDPLFGTLADFDALVLRAHDLRLKVIVDQVLSHSSDKHPWFAESSASRTGAKANWYVWADCQPDGTPPNNWLSVFGGPAWEWDTRRRQFYLHNFLASQPDLNFHEPQVQDALLTTMRFWLDRGVDGFRLDTVNYYFHDPALRNNGPEAQKDGRPAINPYEMQDHVHSKTQPENIAFIKRLRALLDEYDNRALVGEVGENEARSVQVMADYTKGNDRLHMAYSFDMLGPDFTPAFFRGKIEAFFKGAPDGWPSWSFSNHDVNRHVTRWAEHGASRDALAKQAIAMLAGFEGTIGIYQGEELGQTETELRYEELTDPPGLRFWPENKGRDGCRTPMVWERDAANAGFSTGTPWLPVKPPQAARAVDAQEADPASVLHTYREVLAFRRARPELRSGKTHFLDLPAPCLGFRRTLGQKVLTCLYNLSPEALDLDFTGALTPVGPVGGLGLSMAGITLAPNGFAYLESTPETAPGFRVLTKAVQPA